MVLEGTAPTNITIDRELLEEKGTAPPTIDSRDQEGPILVNDEGNTVVPRDWPKARKWSATVAASMSLLCISVAATIYSSGNRSIAEEFEVGTEVATLGLSLYQLGFGIGPLIWSPLSEDYGRRIVFIGSFGIYVLFTMGTALAQNIETMLICRFFAGFTGSSSLTTTPAIISDLFSPADRGLVMSFFAIAGFGGPVIGPVAGSWLLDQGASWRWIMYLLLIFSGVSYAVGLLVPETYAPVRIQRYAARMTKATGKLHRSEFSVIKTVTLGEKLKMSLSRPFSLLGTELIIAFFALYSGFIYGLLYAFFAAFPWIYARERGWSTGLASLPFLAVGVGLLSAVFFNYFVSKAYTRKLSQSDVPLPPETRLGFCECGAVVMPIGLMIFAWTSYTHVHWIVSVLAIVPFGFSLAAVFLSMTSYLLDAYPRFAASALASTTFTRSMAGAAFPLFITQQLEGMGTQWTLFLYAMVAVALAPVPFLLKRYGARIRARSGRATS